jgi:hypothetical protein
MTLVPRRRKGFAFWRFLLCLRLFLLRLKYKTRLSVNFGRLCVDKDRLSPNRHRAEAAALPAARLGLNGSPPGSVALPILAAHSSVIQL